MWARSSGRVAGEWVWFVWWVEPIIEEWAGFGWWAGPNRAWQGGMGVVCGGRGMAEKRASLGWVGLIREMGVVWVVGVA